MGVGISVLIALKATTLLLFFAYLKNLGFFILSLPFLYSSLVSFLVSIASHPSIDLPLLLGKTSDGTFPISSLIIFSPYLYFVRVFSAIRRRRSGEPAYTVVHEGLYVGGWPSSPEKLPPGDPAIIDCTCEFPRLKGFTGGLPYRCVPTWDTRSPQPADIESAVKWACRKRDLNRPVFVHCAYGKYLEAKYPRLYWTPCAAHCLDLMLEDIGKLSTVKRAITRGQFLVGFIYNHTITLNIMRTFTEGAELIRSGVTRFATTFLPLQRLYKLKNNLRRMFVSEAWLNTKTSKEVKGKRACAIVLMTSFWNDVLYSLKAMGAIVTVLRLVDNEKKPAMGYIYEAMDRAKESIAKSFNGIESKYFDIFEIIYSRWECQLHRPLHAAGHFLNPQHFYNDPNIGKDTEVTDGLFACIQRLSIDAIENDKILSEISLYRKASGTFGMPSAVRMKETMSPGHGRSVAVMCALLVALGITEDWKTAEKLIKQKRPYIRMNALHRKALEEWSTDRLSVPKSKRYGGGLVD